MRPDIRESTEFAYEALRDSRDTIRAIDFKANALLVVLAIFAANIDKIVSAEKFLLKPGNPVAHDAWVGVGVLGGIAWIGSFAAVCLILAGRYNPVALTRDLDGASGVFFAARAFKVSLWPLILWPKSSCASLRDHEAAMSLSVSSIFHEVCFEHLKLVYLREAKSARLRFALLMGFASFVLLAILWATAVFAGLSSPTSV